MGNLTGALLAGATLALLPELLRDFSDFRMILFGLLLLLTLLFRPQGIAGIR